MKDTNKTKKGLYIAIGICVAVLLALIVFVMVAAGGGQKQESATEPPVESTAGEPAESIPEPSVTEAPTQPATEPEVTEPAADVVITTPYGELTYPGQWAAFLRTEILETKGYRVEFYADIDSGKNQFLFALTFGVTGTDPVGLVTAPDGNKYTVYVDITPFTPDSSWTDSEITAISSMQEALNDVLDSLHLEPVKELATVTEPPSTEPAQEPDEPTEAPPEETPGDMALDTPYCPLRFPTKWAKNLEVQVEESGSYSVHFYGKFGSHSKQRLFTIHFGGSAGAFFGKVKDAGGNMVEVRVSLYELSLDGSWTDGEKSDIYAMQEDLNYLLDRLG